MSFFLEHIHRIVAAYQGNPPLAAYLKNYFRQYPKLGSRDRKALTEGAFIYYRCRRFYAADVPVATVIARGIAWCNSRNAFLQKMLEQEIQQLGTTANAAPVMDDFKVPVSAPLSAQQWLHSLLQQPQVYIRIRKDRQQCLERLQQHDIVFEETAIPGNTASDCLKIVNGAAIDQVLPEDAYVVQDLSSQTSMYQLMEVLKEMPSSVWDVCSGAGGKSILLKDKLPAFQLLASDIRDSILHNLRARFRKYNLGKVDTLVLNSAEEAGVQHALAGRLFDLVLCDVPCSGSGTWARTPEQFHFFKQEDLDKFEALQFPIAYNAQQYLRPGGMFAYITCSVFVQENEAVAERLQQHTGLRLLQQQVIDGTGRQADCMYVAFFRK